MRACVCVLCVPIASDFSETVEVMIVNLNMVTASVTGMHHVLTILNLTFIQGHTDLSHGNNKCWISSETIQPMHSKCAVKIVRLKVDMTMASLMTLTFIQGHECVSSSSSS